MVPAGFLTAANGLLSRDDTPALASVDLIINGQLQTQSGGVVTGRDVLDILVDDSIRAYFTPESGINGCLISLANCLPTDTDDALLESIPFVQADNLLATSDDLEGVDPNIEDEDDRRREQANKAVRSAPIPPPAPIISTAPLTPRLDIDEPVAGSGNPALIGGTTVDTPIGKGKE